MQKVQELLEKRKQLKTTIRTLDKDAPLHQYDGWEYANTSIKLVRVQLEIEELQKKKRPNESR